MDLATQTRLEKLWADSVTTQKAEFDALQAVTRAEDYLLAAQERYRIARHDAHNARGRLFMAINEDAGIPGDSDDHIEAA